MIIQVLDQKYKCGCEKGMAKLEKPSLLSKLNLIIEWDLCSFPKKKIGKHTEQVDELDENDQPTGNKIEKTVDDFGEDREYLGKSPELKPGDCFLYNGQVIAIDNPNTMILVVSETGFRALERIWEETIVPEIEFLFNQSEVSDDDEIKYEVEEKNSLPGNFEHRNLRYAYWKIWKERFWTKIIQDQKDKVIRCEVSSEDYIYPITVYLDEWKMYYSPDELEPEMVEEAGMKTLLLLLDN